VLLPPTARSVTVKKLWKEFVAFIMTGNVLMLAVAFVVGGLTKKVIDDFVSFIINPIIGAIVGKPEFSNTLKIGKGVIQYGSFINTVINLVITGLVLFLIVKMYDSYQNRKRAAGEEDAGEEPDEEVMLLREIRDALVTRN
jgi:large conductance mechanosensitive channel